MVKKPVSYREQLVLVEKSIERCKADLSKLSEGDFMFSYLIKELKQLEQIKASILDKPELREGLVDEFLTDKER